jgi:hypothetical protein
MAMSLAVAVAPLHSRLVGRALPVKLSGDAAVGSPKESLRAARRFVGLLELRNGNGRLGSCVWLGIHPRGSFAVSLPAGERE